jgi:serine/threonine-protein kinase
MTPGERKRKQVRENGAGSMLGDRYRLEERLAGGGMGEVWRATDTLLERNVAVKLLREALAEDAVVSERFRREALLAAQISHPNMAGVFDYVQAHDRPGIVMEFVDGETLADRLVREGSLPVGEAVRIGSGLLAALQSAHHTGIIHRDVKPGNVMLTANGDVKVTDFGIARAASDQTLTETGTIIGTAHYLSPEQVTGQPATPASDLYSAGAVLFEALTGQKPFEAETQIAVAMKRLSEDPPPVRLLRADVPEPVAAVVDRALSREPDDRFGSSGEMRLALEAALAGAQPATHPHRIDPTTTMDLPAAEALGPEPTVSMHPAPPEPTPVPAAPPDETGRATAAVVAKRRRRKYKRLSVMAVAVAAAVGIGVFLLLALTGGAKVVTTPTFKGMTIEQAKATAADLGLRIKEVPRDSDLAAGRVTGQNIPAGTRLERGAEITLGVSTGNPPPPAEKQVPNVIGLDREEAEAVLTRAGFEVKVSEIPNGEVDPGKVFGQYPLPDDMAAQGSEVTIAVAMEQRKGKKRGNSDG